MFTWTFSRRRSSRSLTRALSSAARRIPQYELLEVRRCLAAALPTSHDQYMLELINLARANPTAYANSLGIALNEGLPAGTISPAAKQPLVFNLNVIDAAQKHSQWMFNTGNFSHLGPGGNRPNDRMRASGYTFGPDSGWGENIAVRTTSAATFSLTDFVKAMEENLFIDKGIAGRTHRVALLNNNFVEVGVGVKTGTYRGQKGAMATQDFARNGSERYLTGVVYADTVSANRFYTPGEGLGGVTIRAIRDGGGQVYMTTSWSSGGYRLQLPPGRYSILASGVNLGNSQFLPDVLMGTENRKLDFVKGTVRAAPEVAVLGRGMSIVRGDTTPSGFDDTLFGSAAVSGGVITKTYTIRNWGNAPLQLTGAPRVTVTGTHASDFQVITQPAATVAGGGVTTFTVRFDPSAAGSRTAVLRFANTDANENPFFFTVAGTGASGIPFFLPAINSAPPPVGITAVETEPDTARVMTDRVLMELSGDDWSDDDGESARGTVTANRAASSLQRRWAPESLDDSALNAHVLSGLVLSGLIVPSPLSSLNYR